MSTLKVQMLELDHLLNCSRRLVVSPVFFCRLVCSILSILSNLLWGILFICCNQFLLYSCILSKTGVIFSYFAICACFIVCSSLSCRFSHMYFISAAVILLASLALMAPFSLSHKRAGSASVLYNFILVFFEVLCGLNMLLIMPTIFKYLLNLLSMFSYFYKISNFLSS